MHENSPIPTVPGIDSAPPPALENDAGRVWLHPAKYSGRPRLHPWEIPALAISSTDCRQRVMDGAPVWYLVPDGVVQYINKYELYTDDRE